MNSYYIVMRKTGVIEDQSAVLRAEDTRPRVPELRVGGQSFVLPKRQPGRESIHLGMGPFDREEDRGGEEIVQVKRVARVLPEIVAFKHEMRTEILFQAGVVHVANPARK